MKTDSDPAFTLTCAQLRAIVGAAVSDALAKAGPRSDAPSDIMSRDMTAKLIGVHPHTVPRLVREEGLPTLRKVGGHWRFNRTAVQAWLNLHPKKTG